MAITTMTGVGLLINGVDLADHLNSITINDGAATYDDTNFTHTAKSSQRGLPTPTITVKLQQDFASGKTHDTLKAALNTAVPIIIRRSASAIRSGTNPEWQFTGKLLEYQPLGGKPGDFYEVTAKFESAGTPLSNLTTAT